jgi:hypothetical protein
MRFLIALCVATFVMLQFSCKNEKQQKTEVLNAASLDSMEVYNAPAGFNTAGYLKKPYRLYTCINVSCASCIEKVNIWDSIYLNLGKSPQVAFIPIAQTKDNFEVFKYLFENGAIKNVQIPFFLDGNNEFTRSNQQLIGNQFDFLLLTDSDNKVLAFETRSDDGDQIRKMIALTKNNN